MAFSGQGNGAKEHRFRGRSTRKIAAALNQCDVPSPGSTWNTRSIARKGGLGAGAASARSCAISLGLSRRHAGVINGFIEDGLLDTRRLLEVAQRFHAAATSATVIDHTPRIAELERKIQNISSAIASGLYSEKLATDLKAFEAELSRLRAIDAKPLPAPRRRTVVDIERVRAETLERLAKGGDVARATLREIFPDAIHLNPDDSGEHLWAVFPCDEGALRVSLLYGTEAERLSALDAAVFAAFARSAEKNAPVGTIGSGGRI